MKKADSEKAIRSLSTQWANTLSDEDREHPSFSSFKAWLSTNGYGGYMDFRSTMGPDYDAEAWFDEELGQMWRR